MKTFALRLKLGTGVKKDIEAFVAKSSLQATFVVTCVGGLGAYT